MLVVLVLEVLILSCYVGICIRNYQSNYYEETISEVLIHELSNYGLDYGYYLDTSYGPGGQVKIGVENIILKKGSYAIDIKYQSCGNPRFLMEYEHQRNEYNISGTNIVLEDIASEKRVNVNIKEEEPARIVFRLSTEAVAGDYLLIENIKITSTFQAYLTKEITNKHAKTILFSLDIFIFFLFSHKQIPIFITTIIKNTYNIFVKYA